MRPHRQQPTRLPRPWDSPGKNSGVGCNFLLQWMKVKRESRSVCLTVSNPMDCSPPGSSAHGIFQARVLGWGAIAFSEANLDVWQTNWSFMDSKRQGFYRDFIKKSSEVHVKVKCESVSCSVRLLRTNSFATPWTVAHQAPLSVEFSRGKYCSCCCSLFRGSSPTQGSNLVSCIAGRLFTIWATREATY